MARFWILFATILSLFLSIASRTVTYRGIGKFDSYDFYHPTIRPLAKNFLPESPEKINPQFKLYTSENRDYFDNLVFNSSEAIENSHFDGSKITKIIVHGFMGNTDNSPWINKMALKLLDTEHDVNVILVDWRGGNLPPYSQAIENTRVVGAMIGVQIQLLVAVGQSSFDNFHIIGHSLGSHVAGYAGKFIGSGLLGRITGLDAAGPGFEGLKPEARLWHTDAIFVDAIHTDAQPLVPQLGFGTEEPFAHIDIYPNGGERQPGCVENHITTWFTDGLIGAKELISCNHFRAVDLYLESIGKNSQLRKAYRCSDYEHFLAGECTDCGSNGGNCVVLGEQTPVYWKARNEIGKRYFMITSSKESNLLSHYQYIVKLKNSQNSNQTSFDYTIRFADQSGRIEKFESNNEKISNWFFHYYNSLTHAGISPIDPTEIAYIELDQYSPFWFFNFFISRKAININQIEVIGLTSNAFPVESSAYIVRFCRNDGQQYKNKNVRFEKC